MISNQLKKVNPVKFHAVDTAEPYFTGSMGVWIRKSAAAAAAAALALLLILSGTPIPHAEAGVVHQV